MRPVLVVAELESGGIRPVTLELMSAARQIRDLSGEDSPEILVLVPDEHPMAAVGQVADATGCKTLGGHWPCVVTPESLKQGLVHILDQIQPSFLLFAHTTMGREVAPALGARLGGCAISGVTGIFRDRDGLVFSRPVMDNNEVLCIRAAHSGLCILTLVPGAFGGREEMNFVRTGEISEMRVPDICLDPSVIRVSMTPKPAGGREIKAAKIVVGAGRGIGDRENLDKVKAFSARLPGACVGASRPLVDQGWISYSQQVGITGAVVAPDLYVACGISGSSQHLAGMGGAKWVVSINKNPDAPICRHSDLCIQADLNEFIDTFLESE